MFGAPRCGPPPRRPAAPKNCTHLGLLGFLAWSMRHDLDSIAYLDALASASCWSTPCSSLYAAQSRLDFSCQAPPVGPMGEGGGEGTENGVLVRAVFKQAVGQAVAVPHQGGDALWLSDVTEHRRQCRLGPGQTALESEGQRLGSSPEHGRASLALLRSVEEVGCRAHFDLLLHPAIAKRGRRRCNP